MQPRLSLCLFVLAGCVTTSDAEVATDLATATTHTSSAIAAWQSSAFVAGWDGVHDRVAFNRRGSDNGFDAYWSDPTGANPVCITCNLPGPPQAQRGVSDVHPSGNYVLATIEKPVHPGTIGGSSSEPGRGVYDDLYIVSADGQHQYQLTNLPADGNHGVIWPRFDRTGTKIVWSQMYGAANIFVPGELAGVWALQIATLAWTNGVPSLTDIQTYDPEPGNFYEPYGFSPDGTQILFASSIGTQGFYESQLYRVQTSLTGLQRLSDNVTGGPGWSNYNEFAFYLPDGAHIIYGRGKDATSGGLDWWIMNADGSHSERLTYLNEPWHAQSEGYAVVGGWAIDPANADHVLFSYCAALTCSNGTAVSMTLTPHSSAGGAGLTGAYYDDVSFTQLAFTRTDVAVDFNWAAAPDPSMPATNFAIRWTGSVVARTTGWHQVCVYSDDGAQLWLGGWLVINAWHAQGPTQNCGWAWLDATTPSSVKLDYFNGWGSNSAAKLSWTGPDGIEELVPTGQLFP